MIDLVAGVLTSSFGFGQDFLAYALPFIFVLSLVVFVHEFGHFIVARWCGVAVEVFSIGFGRAMVSWTDRKNTRWQIGWLPLGGYVKFVGDANAASAAGEGERPADVAPQEAARLARAGHFHFKPLPQRAAVVAAGPLANFLLAIVIFAGSYVFVGEQIVPARVSEVQADLPAAAAGFKAGDLVLTIDGRKITSFGQMQEIVASSAGSRLTIEVARAGEVVVLKATPRVVEQTDRFGNRYKLGLLGLKSTPSAGDVTYVRYDPFTAVVKGVERTAFMVDRTLAFIGRLIMGREDASQLSGPIGIAKVSGEVAQLGLLALINLAAVLSISIGLINLFPIPMLDGGHLLYYAYEAVRGRPLGARAQELGFRVGIALVISMMIFATWNDLVKLQILG